MALVLQLSGMGGGGRLEAGEEGGGGGSKVEEPWVGRRGEAGRLWSVSGHLGEARAATTTAASHTRAPVLRPPA